MQPPRPEAPPQLKLMHLATGFRATSVLAAAAQLEVAEAIAGGARDAESIARRSGANAPLMARLLRALAALELVSEPQPGQFALTPVGELLRGDAPGSMRDVVRMLAQHVRVWMGLGDNVRDGVDAFTAVHHKPVFEWFAEHPAEWQVFDGAMTAMTRAVARAVAEAYDFSGLTTLVDVGGGEGTLLAGILAAHGHLRGVVADLPAVVARARQQLAGQPVAPRIEGVATDFFASVPAGGDAYLLKTVLHDWDDEAAARILDNVRRAAGTRPARLLLIERVLPAQPDAGGAFADLNMMVMCGGRERTEPEWRALLGRTGFSFERVVPLPATVQGTQIIEARPV